MRTYPLLALLAITLFACKQKHTVTPAPTPTATSTADAGKIAGTYTGINKKHYRTDAGSSGIHEDSSFVADTFVITAVAKDSFILTKPDNWEIAKPGFKYDGSNTYTRKRGQPAFNDHMDELTITFDASKHTVDIENHHVSVSSWIMEDWQNFSGKQ